ncbi:MAG: precorrin-8X methylmutase [Micromonosporaceae bacterium]|nr:precorrin-8X methylmutase [Micromonosporaceae bacterium]
MRRVVPPIEAESYQILRREADTSELPRHTRDVVERVVHGSADLDYLADLVCDEDALAAGAAALADGATLVVDSQVVAAGITEYEALCLVDAPAVAEIAEVNHITRSAAGIRLASELARNGAVFAIGTAPTALFELIKLAEAGRVRPALVVGVPVGFVGGVESKAALREAGLPQVSNASAKGGAAVAAAVINALLYGDPLAPVQDEEDGDVPEDTPVDAGDASEEAPAGASAAETVSAEEKA